MATFKIEITVTKKGLRRDKMGILSAILSNAIKNETGAIVPIEIKKVNENPSRADRLAEAANHRCIAQEICQELVDEMDEWYSNLPENLQSSDKASQIEECRDNLQAAVDDLENIDIDSIEFPGMY